jgi:hypothetical protein
MDSSVVAISWASCKKIGAKKKLGVAKYKAHLNLFYI